MIFWPEVHIRLRPQDIFYIVWYPSQAFFSLIIIPTILFGAIEPIFDSCSSNNTNSNDRSDININCSKVENILQHSAKPRKVVSMESTKSLVYWIKTTSCKLITNEIKRSLASAYRASVNQYSSGNIKHCRENKGETRKLHKTTNHVTC